MQTGKSSAFESSLVNALARNELRQQPV